MMLIWSVLMTHALFKPFMVSTSKCVESVCLVVFSILNCNANKLWILMSIKGDDSVWIKCEYPPHAVFKLLEVNTPKSTESVYIQADGSS